MCVNHQDVYIAVGEVYLLKAVTVRQAWEKCVISANVQGNRLDHIFHGQSLTINIILTVGRTEPRLLPACMQGMWIGTVRTSKGVVDMMDAGITCVCRLQLHNLWKYEYVYLWPLLLYIWNKSNPEKLGSASSTSYDRQKSIPLMTLNDCLNKSFDFMYVPDIPLLLHRQRKKDFHQVIKALQPLEKRSLTHSWSNSIWLTEQKSVCGM